MSRALLLCGFSLWLAACANADPVRVKGSPEDVTTAPGTYAGYQVTTECQIASQYYGVLGTGAHWYDAVAPGDPGRADAMRELGRSVIEPALAGVESVSSVGFGTGCTADAGLTVRLSDWRDVDSVIERSGTALAEHDLREEVSITVAVAHSDECCRGAERPSHPDRPALASPGRRQPPGRALTLRSDCRPRRRARR